MANKRIDLTRKSPRLTLLVKNAQVMRKDVRRAKGGAVSRGLLKGKVGGVPLSARSVEATAQRIESVLRAAGARAVVRDGGDVTTAGGLVRLRPLLLPVLLGPGTVTVWPDIPQPIQFAFSAQPILLTAALPVLALVLLYASTAHSLKLLLLPLALLAGFGAWIFVALYAASYRYLVTVLGTAIYDDPRDRPASLGDVMTWALVAVTVAVYFAVRAR